MVCLANPVKCTCSAALFQGANVETDSDADRDKLRLAPGAGRPAKVPACIRARHPSQTSESAIRVSHPSQLCMPPVAGQTPCGSLRPRG